MLAEKFEKVKEWAGEYGREFTIGAIIILVGIGSFGLGRLSLILPKKEPITITTWGNPLEEGKGAPESQNGAVKGESNAAGSSAVDPITQGKYVSSRKGTSYHFPWCPGAKQIKEENKIYFDTKEAAEKAGYKPAGNCEGL